MVLVALGALAWAVLSGATGSPSQAPTAAPASSAGTAGTISAAGSAVIGDPVNGRNLYLQSCASCHGQQGEGTAVAPALTNVGSALVDFVLRTGRMPLSAPTDPSRRKPPAFGPSAIADLDAYVGGLGNGPGIPNVAISGADISLGRDLYIANCAACHGATGAGGAVGGGFVAPSLDQADPLTVAEAILTGPGPMPRFRFSQAEVNAIAAYVEETHHPASPGGLAVAEVGPVAEGFLAGTIGIVTLLVVARWIARPEAGDAAAEAGTRATDGAGPTDGAGDERHV